LNVCVLRELEVCGVWVWVRVRVCVPAELRGSVLWSQVLLCVLQFATACCSVLQCDAL